MFIRKITQITLDSIFFYQSFFSHGKIYNEAVVSSFSTLSFAMTKGYSPHSQYQFVVFSRWNYLTFLNLCDAKFSVSLLHLRGNNLSFVFYL